MALLFCVKFAVCFCSICTDFISIAILLLDRFRTGAPQEGDKTKAI